MNKLLSAMVMVLVLGASIAVGCIVFTVLGCEAEVPIDSSVQAVTTPDMRPSSKPSPRDPGSGWWE